MGWASHSLRTTVHCRNASATDLSKPKRLHDADELLDLGHFAGNLENEMLGVGIDHVGTECLGKPQRLDARIARAGHLDQRQFALKGLVLPQFHCAHREIDDAMHWDDTFQLILDLFEHMRGSAGDDGYPRQMFFMLGLGDRKALDIVTASGKQPDYASKHARLVVDQNRESMYFRFLGLLGDKI